MRTRRGNVLVIQNAPADPVGTLGGPLTSHGWVLDVRDPAAGQALPTLDDYAALVVLGGATNPDDDARCPWLITERALLSDAVERSIPTIAVCLGSQLLAQALGASARRMPTPRIGWSHLAPTDAAAEDPLGTAWTTLDHALEWHTYTAELPSNATLLAGTPDDVQAFRAGERAWGFQYHLEADTASIRTWLDIHSADLHPGEAEAVNAHLRRTDIDHTGHGTAIGHAFAALLASAPAGVAR